MLYITLSKYWEEHRNTRWNWTYYLQIFNKHSPTLKEENLKCQQSMTLSVHSQCCELKEHQLCTRFYVLGSCFLHYGTKQKTITKSIDIPKLRQSTNFITFTGMRAKTLLDLNKRNFDTITDLFTSHDPLRYYLNKMGELDLY